MGKVWFAVCTALLLGCLEQPTQIIVSIDTDYAMPSDLSAVHVRVQRQGAGSKPSLDQALTLTRNDAQRLPLTLALTSPDHKETSVLVTLEGMGPDNTAPLVTRKASARFVRHKKLVLPMNLLVRCAGVACASAQTCGDEGRCEPVERADLDEWGDYTPVRIAGDDARSGDSKDAASDGSNSQPDSDSDSTPRDDGGLPSPSDANDADRPDASAHDAGSRDAGAHDAGSRDAGAHDAGTGDPGPVEDKNAIEGIALGFGHSCVWTYGHEAYCWGGNGQGQLGATTPSECGTAGVCVFHPRKLNEVGAIAELAAGEEFTCALSTTGSVSCFGADNLGQLGNGDGPAGAPSPVVRAGTFGDEPLAGITHIVAGAGWACAQESPSGAVWCWGDNTFQTLGVQTPAHSQRAVKASAKAVADQRLFVGHTNACVQQANGKVECWGGNPRGALQSDSDTFDRSVTAVSVLDSGSKQVSGGANHLCALIGTDVKCWGGANIDQLGTTSTAQLDTCGGRLCALTPVRAELEDQALAVTSGEVNSCALVSGGQVFCWGATEGAIVANASAADPTQAKPLIITQSQPNGQPDTPLRDVRLLPPTFYQHLCVVRGPREVLCWGWQSLGEIGPDPMFSGPVWDPKIVPLPAP